MAMTSRQRLAKTLNHEQPDRVPIDLGSTPVTGIAASTYYKLRLAMGLPAEPVKIGEPFQLLAQVEDDMREKLGIDVVGLWTRGTLFGFKQRGWKPWTLPDGTPAQVSLEFEYEVDDAGDLLIFPKGDRSAPPSGRLPKGGYYFDSIVRQQELDEDHLDPNDWAEQFTEFSDEDLKELQTNCDNYYHNTDYAIIGSFWQGGFGDVALVPGQMLPHPKGIRDPNLWYEFLITHPDYIKGIFEIHCQMALKNLELYRQAVGEKIQVVVISGTDFGTQRSLFCSPQTFRDLWKPYYKRVNDWVHKNTKWKIFYHTCGAIRELIPELIEIGVDVLNPVQCSAEGMDAARLKKDFGDKITFWGGGIDTQKILPFGTPAQVIQQTRERLDIFSPNGGFVFNPIHNIQHSTPPENLMAMYRTVLEYRK